MIRLICLLGLMWCAAWAGAQPCDVWAHLEADSALRQEWRLFCRRNLSFKVAEAERLGLDTLPEIKRLLEGHRMRLAQEALEQEPLPSATSKELRVRISQLFFSLPQNLPHSQIRESECRMDSLVAAIRQGSSFEACVRHCSDDKEAHWVSRLAVPAELEEEVWHLPVGAVSKPFFTPLGLHVVKVLARDSVSAPIGGDGKREYIEHRVRLMRKKCRFVEHRKAKEEWLATGRTSQAIFSLDGKEYRAAELDRFAKAYPARRKAQWEAFVRKTLLDKAYQDWLAEEGTVRALAEYRDDLLAYAVCGRKIQQEGLADEASLKNYFETHVSDYQWEKPRFYGVVIHAVSKRVAKQVRRFFKKLPPEEWKDAIRLTFHPDKQREVCVEQGTFACGENAYVDELVYKKAKALPLKDYPFTVVVGKKHKEPQDYREVRAAVWRDLLADWEQKWLMESRRKRDG